MNTDKENVSVDVNPQNKGVQNELGSQLKLFLPVFICGF